MPDFAFISMADLGSAAAASLVDNNDALVARKLQSVEQLTSIFGFETAVAEQAVDYVLANRSSDDDDNDAPMDVTACYNYIIDQGLGQDQGGPVTPIDTCPHVVTHCCVTANQLPLQPFVCTCTHVLGTTSTTAGGRLLSGGFLKSETANDGVTCEATENWLCLECGVVRCSRYCNGHAAEHFEETKPTTTATKESLDQGHCIAISLSDLSVWCYVCHSYLSTSTGSTGKTLQPVAQLLEDIKFGSSEACSILLLEPERKRHKQSDDEGEPDNQMETEQDNDSSSSSGK